jgi:hypothetical protein
MPRAYGIRLAARTTLLAPRRMHPPLSLSSLLGCRRLWEWPCGSTRAQDACSGVCQELERLLDCPLQLLKATQNGDVALTQKGVGRCGYHLPSYHQMFNGQAWGAGPGALRPGNPYHTMLCCITGCAGKAGYPKCVGPSDCDQFQTIR